MNNNRNRSEEVSINPRRKKYKEYMVRRKIARNFINQSLIEIINKRLKNSGSNILLNYVSKKFIENVSKKGNAKILNMNLKQIFTSEEFYNKKNFNELNNIIKIIKLNSDEYKYIREASGLDKMLNMTFSNVFKEYLSSLEFQKNIEKLKSKSDGDCDYLYLEKYINYSKMFIENYFD